MNKMNVIINASLLVGVFAFTVYAADAVNSVTKTDAKHTVTTVDSAGNIVNKIIYDTKSTSVKTHEKESNDQLNSSSYRALAETRMIDPPQPIVGKSCIRAMRESANKELAALYDYRASLKRCRELWGFDSIESIKKHFPSLADY